MSEEYYPNLRNFEIKKKKDYLVKKLKENKCRITKQRLLLLDILLEENCTSCKDIYYQAIRVDKNIGPATVYRMMKLLEDIGAISRKNMYRINYEKVPVQFDRTDADKRAQNLLAKTAGPAKDPGDGSSESGDSGVLCRVMLDDHTVYALTPLRHKEILEAGLSACGYLSDQSISEIRFSESDR